MKNVVSLRNPRTASRAQNTWARRRVPSYQNLYHSREPFDPSIVWTNFGHLVFKDVEDRGVTREWYESRFRYVFVRNTWSRLVSVYRFHKSRRRKQHYPQLNDFETFLHSVMETDWLRFHQSQLVYLEDGVDFIGRFENLQEDWRKLCELIEIDFEPLTRQFPNYDRSKTRPYQEWYTDALRDKVGEFYAEEIERFGFQFE